MAVTMIAKRCWQWKCAHSYLSCPSFFTVGWAAPCSCCKLGFCIHNLRRKQQRSGRAVQSTASFHPEHGHRWSQHSLSLAFFVPGPPATCNTSMNNELFFVLFFASAYRTQMHHSDRWYMTNQIYIPLRWFPAWVDEAFCLLRSLWLTVKWNEWR